MPLLEDLGHVLAPPHPAGRPFILGGLVAVMLDLALGPWLAWLGLLFALHRSRYRTPSGSKMP